MMMILVISSLFHKNDVAAPPQGSSTSRKKGSTRTLSAYAEVNQRVIRRDCPKNKIHTNSCLVHAYKWCIVTVWEEFAYWFQC
jgi:hypothetical protein